MEKQLKKTPLYETHVKAGGKIVDFGGWALPVQYSGILEEHKHVRSHAGLFDVSHMGEIEIKGPDALQLINKLVCNDISVLQINQAIYSPMCYENGGIVDDLLIYRLGEERYWLVINAANTDKDYAWIKDHQEGQTVVENISSDIAQLALQGPDALSILKTITDVDLEPINYYWCTQGSVAGIQCLISRTGYTGEDGFELYCHSDKGAELWKAILKAGGERVVPAGLGARDTLRFEACMPLYGHELTAEITPLEAGLNYFVKLHKDNFIGKEALKAQKEAGVPRKLAAFTMIDRGIPRAGYPLAVEGNEVGFVTSGTFSPTLQKNLGMGILPAAYAKEGQKIQVMARGKGYTAIVIKKPFYKRNAR
ncbi:glycine cleavage system aminomethyltransferase GcvT [Desulfolucanica intricata]|uniref:glycine cleavage system aminomethyltransferase GcvT n=1 Tax=Desulfolucanica intricata TaxID=1285191 RepID=UPI00082BBEA9|nr:glycine cleavage system aminomethyltransferase GcvT [Desulfolucanica intricata]